MICNLSNDNAFNRTKKKHKSYRSPHPYGMEYDNQSYEEREQNKCTETTYEKIFSYYGFRITAHGDLLKFASYESAATAEEEVIEPHLLRESIRERVRTFPMAPVTAIVLKLP